MLQAYIHAYWVTGATTGAALGTVVPAHIAGLNFAMTALFTVLAIDAFRAGATSPPPSWWRPARSSHGTTIHVALATALPAH